MFHCLVFARQTFVFHGMPGTFIWKQYVSAYAIFKQYLDSLIPALQVSILFIQNICLVCGSEMFVLKTDFRFFVKVILGIPKLENLKGHF